MKIISILSLILLTSCAVWQKDREDIRKIEHDLADEVINE